VIVVHMFHQKQRASQMYFGATAGAKALQHQVETAAAQFGSWWRNPTSKLTGEV